MVELMIIQVPVACILAEHFEIVELLMQKKYRFTHEATKFADFRYVQE